MCTFTKTMMASLVAITTRVHTAVECLPPESTPFCPTVDQIKKNQGMGKIASVCGAFVYLHHHYYRHHSWHFLCPQGFSTHSLSHAWTKGVTAEPYGITDRANGGGLRRRLRSRTNDRSHTARGECVAVAWHIQPCAVHSMRGMPGQKAPRVQGTLPAWQCWRTNHREERERR